MADTNARIVITAENRTQAAFAAMRQNMDGVIGSAGKLRAALGAIGVGVVLAELANQFKGIVQYRSALDDLADTTGDSVTNLDGLARAARVSGTDIDSLGGLLTKLSKNLGDAGDDGKAAAEALKSIGLSVNDLRSQSPAQAFQTVATALGEYADGADKVRVAQALLGKEGAKSLPLLKDLAEEGAQQGRITAEQAAQAEKLEKEFRRLAIAFEDGKQALASALIPEITKLVEEMRTGIEIAGSFGEALRLFGLGINPTNSVAENIRNIDVELDKLSEKRKDVYAFIREDSFAKQEADLKKQREFLKAQQRREALKLTGPRFLDARDLKAAQKPGINFKGTPDKGGKATDEFAQLRQQLEQELARASADGKAEEIRLVLATAKYKDLTAAQREQIVELATLIEKRKEDQAVAQLGYEQEKRELQEQIAFFRRRTDALRESADRFATLADPSLPILKQIQELGDLQKSAFAIDPELADVALFKLNEQLRALQEVNFEVQKQDDLARDLGLTFSSAFEEAIAGGKGLSEVLKGLAADIGKIITRKTITEPLGNAAVEFAKDSGISGFFKDLFRADGGPVRANEPYIVGERGPELFVPGSSGRIVPNEGLGGGGTFYIDARGADAGGLAKLERAIRSLNGSIEQRAVAAVFNANLRGVRA